MVVPSWTKLGFLLCDEEVWGVKQYSFELGPSQFPRAYLNHLCLD